MSPYATAGAPHPPMPGAARDRATELTALLAAAHAQIDALSAQLRRRRGSRARRPVNPTRLRNLVIRLVNEAVLDLHAGNTLLTAMGAGTVNGPAEVTFRVPAAVTAGCQGPAAAICHALAIIRAETDQARWTVFAGCPDGYGIDEPGPAYPPHPARRAVVHTDLRLTVTVAAYLDEDALSQTALGLLRQDLRRMRRLHPSVKAVTHWHDPSWPGEWGCAADHHDFDDPGPDDVDDPDDLYGELDPAHDIDQGGCDFARYDLIDYDPDEAEPADAASDSRWAAEGPAASETYF